MSSTVHLHVGIAKTGTTYLQRTLFKNRSGLERHGTLYPGPVPAAHFYASLDLRGAQFSGYVYEQVDGAWARLVAQADAFAGQTVVSHETFALTKPECIRQAVGSFATDDVRVVVTARDLGRQIPAVWQERLKNRDEQSYDSYLTRLFDISRRTPLDRNDFWTVQDLPALVTRWSEVVGVDNVTVVTVPPPGADRLELWRRFASATVLPDIDYTFPARDNASLGVAEAELLRRVNPLLADSLKWPEYDRLIKRTLVETVLGPLTSQGRLTVPARWRERVEELSAEQVAGVAGSGVRVVGELADLAPIAAAEPSDGRQPGELSDAELLRTATQVIAALVSVQRGAPAPAPPGVRWLFDRPVLRPVVSRLRSAVRRGPGPA